MTLLRDLTPILGALAGSGVLVYVGRLLFAPRGVRAEAEAAERAADQAALEWWRSSLEAMQREVDTLRASMRAERQEHAAEIQELKTALASASGEVSALRHELAQARDHLARLSSS